MDCVRLSAEVCHQRQRERAGGSIVVAHNSAMITNEYIAVYGTMGHYRKTKGQNRDSNRTGPEIQYSGRFLGWRREGVFVSIALWRELLGGHSEWGEEGY
jgi:hypothetical protein